MLSSSLRRARSAPVVRSLKLAARRTMTGEVRAPVGDLAARMLKAKEASGKTFDELADELGWTNAYTCQLILGQAQLKPATTETGLIVQVPPYLAAGEVIRVDTRDGHFVERVKA